QRHHGRDNHYGAHDEEPAPGLPGPGRGAAALAGRLVPRPRLLGPVLFLALVILRPVLAVPRPTAPVGLAHRGRPALDPAGASRVDALPGPGGRLLVVLAIALAVVRVLLTGHVVLAGHRAFFIPGFLILVFLILVFVEAVWCAVLITALITVIVIGAVGVATVSVAMAAGRGLPRGPAWRGALSHGAPPEI